MSRMGGLFLLNCLGNACWIFAWHYEQVALSLVIMLVILTSLLLIQQRFGIFLPGTPARERFFVHIPFAIYLGWIAVATIANTTALLVHINWLPAMSPGWALIMCGVATIFTLLAIFGRNNIPYALVSLWALAGINLKRSAAGGAENENIIIAASVCMVVIGLAIIIQLFRSRKSMIRTRH
ncbi:hypothetical protein MKQ70_08620 [Chitinophaga sedimenti]|uniref:hypothetical protein n=1 Tax=Chitinophaga sedimenti TaxID=2033606 RepID=UPI002005C859|nr:hypothetical protein [Chitinophaga sedimenti]MCK7555069.1 hypothetical protein [Chitinophaga sedimenti]